MSYIEGSELEKESWKRFFKFLGDDVKEKMEGIAKTYIESEEKAEKPVQVKTEDQNKA